MAEGKTYVGGCHCGNVRFEVEVDLREVMECNCSICSKTGSRLAFATPEHFRLLAGGDHLSGYQFKSRKIHHLFCPVCGIRSFARGSGPDGREMVAINVRCLEGVDHSALTVRPFDGRSLQDARTRAPGPRDRWPLRRDEQLGGRSGCPRGAFRGSTDSRVVAAHIGSRACWGSGRAIMGDITRRSTRLLCSATASSGPTSSSSSRSPLRAPPCSSPPCSTSWGP